MKKVKSFFLIFLAVVFFSAFTVEVYAQKRKPTLKKATTRTTTPQFYRVDAGTVIRVRMNDYISSKTARVGDTFTVNVIEPVYSSNGVLVIPVGSVIKGRVDAVTPAKKGGNPGTIDVSFISVRLPNGTVRAINGSLTSLTADDAKSDEEGTAKGDRMKHRKVIFIGGGAGGGALIGAAVGGAKGAVIGGIIGAGAGILGERLTKGEEAEVKPNTEFGVYLNQSLTMRKWIER